MTVHLCPRGHPVALMDDGRGACDGCENVYPPLWLIPVHGPCRERQYPWYARVYRMGYMAALERTESPPGAPLARMT